MKGRQCGNNPVEGAGLLREGVDGLLRSTGCTPCDARRNDDANGVRAHESAMKDTLRIGMLQT
jgi:hypothetical protein